MKYKTIEPKRYEGLEQYLIDHANPVTDNIYFTYYEGDLLFGIKGTENFFNSKFDAYVFLKQIKDNWFLEEWSDESLYLLHCNAFYLRNLMKWIIDNGINILLKIKYWKQDHSAWHWLNQQIDLEFLIYDSLTGEFYNEDRMGKFTKTLPKKKIIDSWHGPSTNKKYNKKREDRRYWIGVKNLEN